MMRPAAPSGRGARVVRRGAGDGQRGPTGTAALRSRTPAKGLC